MFRHSYHICRLGDLTEVSQSSANEGDGLVQLSLIYCLNVPCASHVFTHAGDSVEGFTLSEVVY